MFANIATIDGPPASGKTTMAKMIAKELGLIHIDSGSVFRAITTFCLEKGSDFSPANIISQLPYMDIKLDNEHIYLNGKDVSETIRTPYVTKNVCRLSNLPEVRKFVKDFQLEYSNNGKIICDGRKVGTEVFPEASVKFYLTADQRTRALRRFLQLRKTSPAIAFADVYDDLKEREETERANKILLIPENAIIIDNTSLTIEETFSIMEEYLLQ